MPKNSERPVSDYITIHFHGAIPPLEEVTYTSSALTCEDIVHKCLKHIHNFVIAGADFHGPLYSLAFGLVICPEEEIWLPHSYVFEKRSEEPRGYKFRVRHRLPDDSKKSNILFEYQFLQALHDFLKGPVGKSKRMGKQQAFDLLPLALLFPQDLPIDGNRIVDRTYREPSFNVYTLPKMLSEELKKKVFNVSFAQFVLPGVLKNYMMQYKKFDDPMSLHTLKLEFCQKIVKVLPNYCLEEYNAKVLGDTGRNGSNECTVPLGLLTYNRTEPAILYDQDFQQWIMSIESMILSQPMNLGQRSWEVHIHTKKGMPKILTFDQEGAAESFISMVEGYCRLCRHYRTCLNKQLRTKHAEISENLRSFGPLHSHTASDYLVQAKRVVDPTGRIFLIHESVSEFHQYVVLWRSQLGTEENFQEGGEFGESRVNLVGNKEFELVTPESEVTVFKDCVSLRRYLSQKFGQQVYPKYYPVIAEINNIYGKTILEESLEDEIEPLDFDDRPRFYLQKQVEFGGTIPDKCQLVKKFKVTLPGERDATYIKPAMANSEVSSYFLKDVEKVMELCEIDPQRFLKFCGTVMGENCVLLEYSPLDDLLTYICSNPQRVIQTVGIMFQILKILQVLEENKIYHGNLRSRRFLVFPSGENRESIRVKLGEPGLTAYLDKLPVNDANNIERLPWLSPERRKQLDRISIESECYALGTCLCELLYRTDQFQQILGLNGRMQVAEYLSCNKHLPSPPILTDRSAAAADVGANSSSNNDNSRGDDLVPAARDVLNRVWKEIILPCWVEDPAERATPETLIRDFADIHTAARKVGDETVWESTKSVVCKMGLEGELKKRFGMKKPNLKELWQVMKSFSEERIIEPDRIRIDVDPRTRKEVVLGQGNYGAVCKGTLKPLVGTEELKVAVKVIKDKRRLDDIQDFVKEVMTCTRLRHPNIIKMLHLSFRKDSVFTLMLVMELMDTSLLKFSQKKEYIAREDFTRNLLNLSLDVVKAMIFLGSEGIVHRDLAARNVLVAMRDDRWMAKVSDFGLARNMEDNYRFYQLTKTTGFSIYCWPPECLIDQDDDYSQTKFSTAGDVWSYGTLLWEAFSRGEHITNVVSGLAGLSPKGMCQKYREGWRFPWLKHTHLKIYDVMKTCWQFEPQARPDFGRVKKILEDLIPEITG